MGLAETNKQGVTFTYGAEFAQSGGAVHGFSTRLGGVSTGVFESLNLGLSRGDDPDCVRENYRRFFDAVGVAPGKVAMSNQVHGDYVRLVTSADIKEDLFQPSGQEADGLVTDLPGVALVIFGADCLPILFHDPVRRVVAACHAGWRGTAQAIASKTVERMKLYGCRPEDIRVAIGPGIRSCCFFTHEDVPNAMTTALGVGATPYISHVEGSRFAVDLQGLNRLWLTKAGVPEANIETSEDCTSCHPERYWSHRAMATERGSQAAVIQLS